VTQALRISEGSQVVAHFCGETDARNRGGCTLGRQQSKRRQESLCNGSVNIPHSARRHHQVTVRCCGAAEQEEGGARQADTGRSHAGKVRSEISPSRFSLSVGLGNHRGESFQILLAEFTLLVGEEGVHDLFGRPPRRFP